MMGGECPTNPTAPTIPCAKVDTTTSWCPMTPVAGSELATSAAVHACPIMFALLGVTLETIRRVLPGNMLQSRFAIINVA